MQRFATLLRQKRNEAGLSQRELGRLADVDFSYISKLENDRIPAPAIATIYRLAEALGCDVEVLLSAGKKVPIELRDTLSQPEALRFLREASRLRLSPMDWEALVTRLQQLRRTNAAPKTASVPVHQS
jgi:transcriptional regulator with XRE-family HTH domain